MILSRRTLAELSVPQLTTVQILLTLVEKSLINDEPAKLVFKEKSIRKVGAKTVRVDIPENVREILREEHDIYDSCIFLMNPMFDVLDNLMQIQILSVTEDKKLDMLLLYKKEEKKRKKTKKPHYLSLELDGINPITAVNPDTGDCLIFGVEYDECLKHYEGKIKALREKYLRQDLKDFNTRRMKNLIKKRDNTLHDLLHKLTRKIVDYCRSKDITSVVAGSFKTKWKETFPYQRFLRQLQYKLKLEGIELTLFNGYQHYPICASDGFNTENIKELTKAYWKDMAMDALGAWHLLTGYLESLNLKVELPPGGFLDPKVINVSN